MICFRFALLEMNEEDFQIILFERIIWMILFSIFVPETHIRLSAHRVLHVNKIRIDWLVREFLDAIETSNQNFFYALLDEQNVERASTIAITTHRAFILPL